MPWKSHTSIISLFPESLKLVTNSENTWKLVTVLVTVFVTDCRQRLASFYSDLKNLYTDNSKLREKRGKPRPTDLIELIKIDVF